MRSENVTWHNMPASDRKISAEAAIESVLQAIERSGREPDDWERFQVAGALSAIASGMYWLAQVCAHLALTPINERSMEGASRYREELKALTLERLKRDLAYVRGILARDFGRTD